MIGQPQAVHQVRVPDAVLGLLSAGVGLLAVAVAKAGVEPQRDFATRRRCAELVDHVRRAAIDVDAVLHHQLQRLGVEDVGRVNDRRRVALSRISGGQRPANLARAHRVDQHAVASHQVQDRQVRASLLGEANDVERRQVGHALEDLRPVIDIGRRAKLLGQRGDRHAGDFLSHGRKTLHTRHRTHSSQADLHTRPANDEAETAQTSRFPRAREVPARAGSWLGITVSHRTPNRPERFRSLGRPNVPRVDQIAGKIVARFGILGVVQAERDEGRVAGRRLSAGGRGRRGPGGSTSPSCWLAGGAAAGAVGSPIARSTATATSAAGEAVAVVGAGLRRRAQQHSTPKWSPSACPRSRRSGRPGRAGS